MAKKKRSNAAAAVPGLGARRQARVQGGSVRIECPSCGHGMTLHTALFSGEVPPPPFCTHPGQCNDGNQMIAAADDDDNGEVPPPPFKKGG